MTEVEKRERENAQERAELRVKNIVLHGELINVGPGQDLSKLAVGNHLQIGVVAYDNEDGSKITYLLDKEGIDAMRPTAAGIPIVGKSGGFDHVKVDPNKKYDGKVTDSFWDGDLGWERAHFSIENSETVEACRNGFQLSCAYVPTEVDETPGEWHHVPYDAIIKNGRFTHIAVVPVPRYEGAKIELLNSIGGKVNTTLKAILAAVMPVKALKELVNSIEEDEKKSKKDKAKADFENALKNAATEEEKDKAKKEYENALAAADKPGAADDAERKNAAAAAERKNKISMLRNAADAVEKATGDAAQGAPFSAEADRLEKLPLGGGDVPPDPGVTQAGTAPQAAVGPEKSAAAIAAAEEAKKNADAAGAAAALKDEAAAAEALKLKNAADAGAAAAKKEEEEVAKALEVKNSLAAKAEADAQAKKDAERLERFNALDRAAAERGNHPGLFSLTGESMQEKAALGQELYG